MRAFLTLLRFVSLRHLLAAPLRSALALLGVALGVAMVVATHASNGAVLHAFDELSDRTGGKGDLEIVGDESGVDQGLVVELGDALSPRTIAHVAGRIEQTTTVRVGGAGRVGVEGSLRVLVLGVDFLGDLELAPFAATAALDAFRDPLELVNDPHAILLGETLARTLSVGVDSVVQLRTARGLEEFHVAAILAESEGSRAFGGQFVVLSLDAAQLAFDRDGRVDRIDVALRDRATIDDGARALEALVGARGHVQRPSARGAQLTKMTAAFTSGLDVTGALAVLVGMFLVYNAVGVAVLQRRREIGVLRALGVSRASVARIFLVEAALLGALGSALGVPLGALLARVVIAQFGANVSRFFENIPPPQTHVDGRLVALGVLVGVLATAIASLVPAIRAARTTPMETLRTPQRASAARLSLDGRARALLLLAAVLAAIATALVAIPSLRARPISGVVSVGLVFLSAACITPLAVALLARVLSAIAERVFGVAARLGVDNVARALSRSALTTTALMMATALSITMSTYTSSYEVSCLAWVDASIPADLIVSAGSPLANDRDVIAFAPAAWKGVVEQTPGVSRVDLVRSLSVPYEGPQGFLRLEVLSLDSEGYLGELGKERDTPRDFQRVVEGPAVLPRDALSREPAALLGENLAFKLGLHPGDFVELPTPTGPHRFVVVASVVDYSSDQGLVMIDRRFAIEYFRDDRADSMHVYLAPGVDPIEASVRVRDRLARATGGDAGLFVTTNAALKEEIREVVRRTFGISKASEAIAMIVAVLGVVGTMLAAVIDRKRELGVLRAIGATRRQIVASVVAESATLGLCAGVIGVAVAVPAAWVFVDVIGVQASGWHIAYRFPWAVAARVMAGVVVMAAASGVLPGVRAARGAGGGGRREDAKG